MRSDAGPAAESAAPFSRGALGEQLQAVEREAIIKAREAGYGRD